MTSLVAAVSRRIKSASQSSDISCMRNYCLYNFLRSLESRPRALTVRKRPHRSDGEQRGISVAQKVELDLDNYFPYLINRVGVALVAAFETGALREHQLSIAMWRVLAALSKNGGQRLVDLGQMTSIDVSTLSRMVTRLLRLDLVTRTRSKTSDREIVVKLTAKGQTALTQLIPTAFHFEEAAIGGISRGDLAVVKRALQKMHENMSALPAIFEEPP